MEYPNDYINKIICGDCLEVTKGVPNNCIDLIITSPFYNMGGTNLGYQPRSVIGQKLYNEYNDNLSIDNYRKFIFDTIDMCILKSRYVFWNMQMLSSTKEVIIELIWRYKKNLKDIFIWNKQAVAQMGAKDNPKFATGFEFVFCLGENNSRCFDYANFPKNGYVPNIKTWYKKISFKEHHATFPEELPKYFIEYFTKKGDIILDPMCGIGTTCKMAKKLGRKYIGIDINKKYCEISKRRINATPEPLF